MSHWIKTHSGNWTNLELATDIIIHSVPHFYEVRAFSGCGGDDDMGILLAKFEKRSEAEYFLDGIIRGYIGGTVKRGKDSN